MNSKLILSIFLAILLIGVTTAGKESLGTFKQGDTVRIVQVCDDASYVNISSVSYPNGSIALGETTMTSSGSGEFYTDFTDTSTLGTYDVRGISDGCEGTFTFYFEITPSGSSSVGTGESMSYIGSLIVMLVIAITFLITGFVSKNLAAKISFFCFSGIVFIMSILFIVISTQQNLYGFTSLVSATETFWFVIKFLVGIGILSLFIIIGLIIKKAWRIKRGYQ